MSADINLDNINVDLDLSGSADFGLDAIALALTQGINASVAVNAGLDNIVANAKVDAGLDKVKIVADADIGLDDVRIKELPIIRTDSKIEADLGLDDIRIRELPTIRFELSMRPIRIHLPLKYSFCLELFGVKLFKFSVCGEGMAITEDNQPRETERCG